MMRLDSSINHGGIYGVSSSRAPPNSGENTVSINLLPCTLYTDAPGVLPPLTPYPNSQDSSVADAKFWVARSYFRNPGRGERGGGGCFHIIPL